MKTTHKSWALLTLALVILILGRATRSGGPGAKPMVLAAGIDEQQKPEPYTIRVGVGLTVLPVTVTDNHHHRVTGLAKNDFQVFEDGRPQQITVFQGEDAPVTVGLVVDNSLSMQPRREAVIIAALAFAKNSNPQDQVFVLTFNQTIHMELAKDEAFTHEPEKLRRAFLALQPMGSTALYDALVAALEHLKSGTGDRKCLIVVSDGGDNASQHTLDDVVQMAKASDAEIYSLAIINENYDANPEVLMKLSKLTGGEYFQPETDDQVIDDSTTVARDLRQQYTLGYVPTNQSTNGQFRKVKVVATAPNAGKLQVHTREGYIVPGASATRTASVGSGSR